MGTTRKQLEELLEMEKLMNVYEEITAEDTDFQAQHDQLVNPVRHFVRTDVLEVKEAPFSSSKPVMARSYLFEDLVILAVPVGGGSPESVGSVMDEKSRTTLDRTRERYRVWRWLDLNRCSTSMSKDNVIHVTFVTRQAVESKKGTMKVLTKVEKVELGGPSEVIQQLYTQITLFIEDLIEIDLRRASLGSMSDVASVSSAGDSTFTEVTEGDGERKRSWAARKNTLRRNGTLKSKASTLRRNASSHSIESESVGGLSLSDIESRYQLNLDAPTLPDGSVEFLVEFGEGMMGFSLSSGAGVGVIVGRVAETSFSDEAGVCVGDRVVEVDDTPIDLETRWQDVVEMIKTKPRPLCIKFERFAGRVQEKAPEAKKEAAKKDGAGGDRRRAWAKKRQQRAHAKVENDERLISLSEVEKLYKSGNKAESENTQASITGLFANVLAKGQGEAYSQAAKILEEIWSTERTYVSDLRTLVREFIIPLRRKVRRTKCKDAEGSRICEHGNLRSQCTKSSGAESMLSNLDMRTIFTNIETLVKVNTELLSFIEAELKALDGDADVFQVASVYGPAFQKVLPFFKLYGVYCHQYPTAIDHLLVCRTQNAELNDVLKTREARAKMTLNSLLIRPVQRICKYPLLFNALLKNTHQLQTAGIEEHIRELEVTAKTVEMMASQVNDIVGREESQETLIDIFNELGGETVVPWLISPSRKFISRVNVLMHEAPYTSEAKLHVMFICNDLVLLGKSKELSSFGGTGTGKKNRASSLKRVFTSSLKGSVRGSVRSSAGRKSTHKSGTRTLGKITVKLVKTMELKSITPRLLSEKDAQDCSGIELKYVERTFEPATKSASGKQVTKIGKLRIWLPTEPEQADVYTKIEEALEALRERENSQKKAEVEHGGRQRARRNWKSGRHGSGVASRTGSLRAAGHRTARR